jgi:uncharacterized membrane protein
VDEEPRTTADPAIRLGRSGRRGPSAVTWIAIAIGLLTIGGLVILWPGPVEPPEGSGALQRGSIVEGHVVLVELGPCGGVEPPPGVEGAQCRRVTVALDEGPDAGSQTVLDFPDEITSPDLRAGERILLERPKQADRGAPYGFYDRIRTPSLVWLALLFAVLVVVLGRLRGIGALVGLAVSFLIVMRFVIPAILDGEDPVAVAGVGASAIAFVVIYLAAGISERTTIALLGSLAGLAIAIAIAEVWVPLAKLSGLGSEESFVLTAIGAQIDLSGLLLAGIVIGALGAIDDVTVTQVASVYELKEARPRMGPNELYRSAMRIGRDHIGSIVNTLILAYAGASLPLLILISLSNQATSQVIGSEAIASELVRTFAGSIGLILAMPITTWIAARVAASER